MTAQLPGQTDILDIIMPVPGLPPATGTAGQRPGTHPFWTDGVVTIRHGNALALPLPDASVDLVVTSPPYFGLRSYQDDGAHYDGQVGSEPTPREFLDALIAATAEMARVLKPAGSIFVNLGDKYARPGGGGDKANRSLSGAGRGATMRRPTSSRSVGDIPEKSLMLLPERYRIRCVDELGLIARAVIVWGKPNGLPESVTDRVRRSHEDWVHLTKEPRYFTGIDEIREGYEASTLDRNRYARPVNGHPSGEHTGPLRSDRGVMAPNPLGKLPGSVWTIPTQPLRVPWGYGVQSGRVARHFPTEADATAWLWLGTRAERRRIRALPDHFAAFPLDWPRRLIAGWSPSGICTACGEGRRPVVKREPMLIRPSALRAAAIASGNASRTSTSGTMLAPASATLTGYACACDVPTAPTRPARILDPFAGTGTVGVAARALGRDADLVDLSADYCRLARWRVTDVHEQSRVLRVKKKQARARAKPAPAGVEPLFALDGTAS